LLRILIMIPLCASSDEFLVLFKCFMSYFSDVNQINHSANQKFVYRLSAWKFTLSILWKGWRELKIIDNGIDKKIMSKKVKLEEVDYLVMSFQLGTYQFCQQLGCFRISILRCFDIILFNGSIFPYVSGFSPYFVRLFKTIRIYKSELNCFWMNEKLIRNCDSVYFANTNDAADCHLTHRSL
jgi:hypothetical protein